MSFIFHFSRKRKFSLADHFPSCRTVGNVWYCLNLVVWVNFNSSGNIAHAQTKGVVNPAEILLTAVTLSSLKCNIFSVALKR